MLQYLRIENLALLREVTLDFDRGFTAVTGETGAGKSILLGALNLLAGARADKTLIHADAESCSIEASLYFEDTTRIDSILDKLHLPPCDENALILKRSLFRNKSPKITVNGSLAALAALQSLSEFWIDFHGPGEPQKLFHAHYQRTMLDLFAGLTPLTHEYGDLFKQWKGVIKAIDGLKSGERLSDDEIAFYQSQIDKIQALNPTEESIAELEQSFNRASKSQEIAELSCKITEALDGENGITGQLHILVQHADELANIDPSTAEQAQRVKSLLIETQDIAEGFEGLTDPTPATPEAIAIINEQMNQWLEIQRQYGPSLEAVLQKKASLEQKLGSQTNIEAQIDDAQADADRRKKELSKLADEITKKRTQFAEKLSKKVQPLLKKLGFPKAKFSISLPSENELKEYGNCSAEFLFCPNPGQDILPLSKIASSGETARVMLALKSILAEVDQTPLLVFDEVDANVGGEIATMVASEMKQLAKNHQVFCITHLPQVAAQADHHYVVTKSQKAKNTSVAITYLEKPKLRVEELARMLGDRTSSSAIHHAEELLAVQ